MQTKFFKKLFEFTLDTVKIAAMCVNIGDRYIICNPVGGLGNRLLGLVSSWRLADKLGRQLIINWNKSFDCQCDLKDLIDNKFNRIFKKRSLGLIDRQGEIRGPRYRSVIYDTEERFIFLPVYEFVGLTSDVPNILADLKCKDHNQRRFSYDKIDPFFKEEMAEYFRKLSYIKPIQDKIDDFIQKNSSYSGVHVRRKAPWEPQLYNLVPGNEEYFKLLDKTEGVFFLSTDSPQTEREFIDRYGKKVLMYKKNENKQGFYGNTGTKDVQDALIDMLLLSYSKMIYGSPNSSFTKAAWWLGGAKVKIIIPIATDSGIRHIGN